MDWTDQLTGPGASTTTRTPPTSTRRSTAARSSGKARARARRSTSAPSGKPRPTPSIILPAGFEVAGNFYARQGYPKPIFIQVNTGAFEGTTNVLAQDVRRRAASQPLQPGPPAGQEREVRRHAGCTLSVEGFNVFNVGTELNRNTNAGSATYNRLEEIQAPRIVRFGARFNF